MAVDLPDWCELVRGDGPVLLVAPHGGRRPRVDATAPPANLKVNDVYTAELTRELAARLRATAIINHGCDRNLLDLNRISQVRRRAPWFFELLGDEIEAVLAQHAQAEILFIHGWNVGQAKCDIGIGTCETPGGLVTPDGARLAVTQRFLEDRIMPLRAALEERDIATFLGVRYPASHANNLVQAFTARAPSAEHSPAERRLAAWAAAGRLQAMQLELGVPLRWPGPRRERLLDCLVSQFGAPEDRPSSLDRATSDQGARDQSSETRRAFSLQFYDPAADIGLLAGIGPIGNETTAARLLLFLGGQRVALFTGERTPARGLLVEPLHFESDEGGTTLRFAGPILQLDDGATYLDLEAAFAASTLTDMAVEVRFVRRGTDALGAEFGRAEGWVDLGGERREISAGAWANAGIARAGQRGAYAMLAADFGDDHGILANIAAGAAARVIEFRGEDNREIQAATVKLPDAAAPSFELTLDGAAMLRALPGARMEILRSLGGGRYTRVTFGTTRFDWGERRGHGLYEYSAMVQASPA
jgi:hypothetical protein